MIIRQVDLQPPTAQLLAYCGDPFTLRLIVRQGGAVVDVSGWEWRATIDCGRGLRIDFGHAADTGGVSLWLSGDSTALLAPGLAFNYDVTGRHPDAGEGLTVLRGRIIAAARVTDPLRHDPELVPS